MRFFAKPDAGAIVVFSGTDGAGKSTQIDLLRETLQRSGNKTVTLWSRGGYTPGMNFLKSILRKGAGSASVPAGPSRERTAAFSRPIVRKVWLSLAIVDLAILYGVWLRWRKLSGNVVICDRYLQDTALDFELNFPSEQIESWLLWKLLRTITPKPTAAFLLTVPVTESQRRSLEKQEPFPDSRETLEERLRVYQSWATDPNWYTLSGLSSRESLAEEIRTRVQDSR